MKQGIVKIFQFSRNNQVTDEKIFSQIISWINIAFSSFNLQL